MLNELVNIPLNQLNFLAPSVENKSVLRQCVHVCVRAYVFVCGLGRRSPFWVVDVTTIGRSHALKPAAPPADDSHRASLET